MKRPFPLATLAILTASVAVYLAELAGGGMSVCQALGFIPADPSFGTAVLSMWLHDPDHVGHIAGNLTALAVVGSVVEPVLGSSRLVALYLAAGLGGAAMQWLVQPHAETALVGASGSIAGLMAVGAVVRPRVMLAFVVSYMTMNLLGLFISTPLMPPGTSLACHVGGFTCGVATVLLAEARGVRWVVA